MHQANLRLRTPVFGGTKVLPDLSRMHIQEHRQHEQHQQRVKDPERPFVREQISHIPSDEFGDSKDRADHDQYAGGVERTQVSLPWHGHGADLSGRNLTHASVEGERRRDEQAKESELDKETRDDNILTSLGRALGAGGHETRTWKGQVS